MTKIRRTPTRQAELLASFLLRHALRIEHMAVDHDEVVVLAAETKLSAYDTSYLWLARALGVELVTLDGKLGAAARG